MVKTLLALGGNVGDPVRSIERALEALSTAGVRIVARSRFYRTPPWGPIAQPDFVNFCCVAETDLGPQTLLALTQGIETTLGRERGPRWGPRPIDIDILAMEDFDVEDPGLRIPHPRLTERAFVLVPLRDVAPDWVIGGRTVREWTERVDATGITPLIDAAAGATRAG